MTHVIDDRYELGENIGNGGMSQVFAAQDSLLGRGVAVKVLRLELARDVNFRERFRREAQNSGRLNHPSIVAVYDTGETKVDDVDVPFIVMERVHGRTLRDIVAEDGPMSPTEAAEALAPVCDALQTSHEAGIIHRDVKPANIMVTNTGAVKIMDFGIARALDDSTSAMTQTSAVIGTAQYLSPEQARGKAADGRSDVYALGCVLYEAMTGNPPFQGETPFAVAYQHVQEEATPPSELISGLTPTEAVNVDAVVLTAMAKHPADRYQDAAEMGGDLRLLARNAVTRAARTHLSPENGGTAADVAPTAAYEEQPTRVAPAAVGAGAGAAAGSGAPNRAGPEGREDAGGRKRNRWLAVVIALLLVVVLGVVAAFTWDALRPTGNGASDPEPTQEAPEMVTIPDVSNMAEDEAVAALEQAGLTVQVTDEPSPDVEEGNVLRVDPAVGSELQRGTQVTLVVSSGEEMTDVPDIRGMTTEQAAGALSDAGLGLDQTVQEDSSDTVAEGRVISQNPTSGSQLAVGSTVSITVSTGAEMVRIPSLTGMNWDQAQQTLTSLEFVPEVEYVDSEQNEGTVLNVANQGTEQPRGSAVAVQVSNGQLIQMPDITRMDRGEAISALRDAGWEAPDSSLRTGEPVDTGALVDEGLVASVSPSAGETIRRDQAITARFYEFDLGALSPVP